MSNIFKSLIYSTFLIALIACGDKKEEKSKTVVFKPKSPQEEIAEISNMLNSRPKDVLLLKRRGNLYLQTEQYFLAANDFKWGIFYDENDQDLFLGLANAFKFQGKVDSALFTLKLVETNLIPTNDVFLLAGEIHLIKRDYTKALEAFDAVIKNAPFFAKAYYLKGLTFAELRDTVRAISSIQTAIEQDPDFLDAYYSLSALYVGQKNFKASMQALRSAFLLSPYDELLNLNIAIVYRNMAETDSAIRYFQRAIKINPNNKEAGLAIAQALIKQDKPQEALPYIDDYPVVTPFFLELKIDAYTKLGQPDSVKKYAALLSAL